MFFSDMDINASQIILLSAILFYGFEKKNRANFPNLFPLPCSFFFFFEGLWSPAFCKWRCKKRKCLCLSLRFSLSVYLSLIPAYKESQTSVAWPEKKNSTGACTAPVCNICSVTASMLEYAIKQSQHLRLVVGLFGTSSVACATNQVWSVVTGGHCHLQQLWRAWPPCLGTPIWPIMLDRGLLQSSAVIDFETRMLSWIVVCLVNFELIDCYWGVWLI